MNEEANAKLNELVQQMDDAVDMQNEILSGLRASLIEYALFLKEQING